jgi:nucleoside-diphosphate-sugar epimerase
MQWVLTFAAQSQSHETLAQWSYAGAGQYKQVDSVGTANLIEAAKKAGVKKFVLLTSLLTNAKAVGQADNNNYKFLNVRTSSKRQALECCTVLHWTLQVLLLYYG